MKYPFTEYMKTAATLGDMPRYVAGLGSGAGALIGAGAGALVPSRDERGETHRLRNAMIGGLGGGILGGVAGYGTGAFTRRQAGDMLHEIAQGSRAPEGITLPAADSATWRTAVDATPVEEFLGTVERGRAAGLVR